MYVLIFMYMCVCAFENAYILAMAKGRFPPKSSCFIFIFPVKSKASSNLSVSLLYACPSFYRYEEIIN